MEKNLLNNYIFYHLDSIEQNLSIYEKDKNPICLHRLRVEIKKIRAIFSFAENIYHEKFVATKLKPLFQKAGKLREMHLHIHLLSATPYPLERLITRLKKKENILIEHFIKNVSRYIMLIKDFREKTCLPEMLSNKKEMLKYFISEQKKANKILQDKDREGMHEYRKKIKKLNYVYNVLPKKIQKMIDFNKTEFNNQQKRLGNWHDNYAAINYFSKEYIPLETSEYFQKLKKREERQFNTLYNSLSNKLK